MTANRFGVRGIIASFALLLAYFVGDALIHEEATELGYALALLAVFGSAAGFGYILFAALKEDRGPNWRLSPDIPGGEIPGRNLPVCFEEVPATVARRYASFSFLFSGLAGWVEVRR